MLVIAGVWGCSVIKLSTRSSNSKILIGCIGGNNSIASEMRILRKKFPTGTKILDNLMLALPTKDETISSFGDSVVKNFTNYYDLIKNFH